MKEMVLNMMTSGTVIDLLIPLLAMLAAHLFTNFVKRPKHRKIGYRVADKLEKATAEDTTLDNFLDEFKKEYKLETGKDPSAGALKTAVDIKKEVEVGNSQSGSKSTK